LSEITGFTEPHQLRAELESPGGGERFTSKEVIAGAIARIAIQAQVWGQVRQAGTTQRIESASISL
jgi:hypothetical protein